MHACSLEGINSPSRISFLKEQSLFHQIFIIFCQCGQFLESNVSVWIVKVARCFVKMQQSCSGPYALHHSLSFLSTILLCTAEWVNACSCQLASMEKRHDSKVNKRAQRVAACDSVAHHIITIWCCLLCYGNLWTVLPQLWLPGAVNLLLTLSAQHCMSQDVCISLRSICRSGNKNYCKSMLLKGKTLVHFFSTQCPMSDMSVVDLRVDPDRIIHF